MNSKKQKDEGVEAAAEPFDAVAAAAELEEALGDMPRDSGDVAALQNEIQKLRALVAERENEAKEAHGRADRAQAEITTSRSRLLREAKQESERRMQGVLLSVITMLDDLDRALAAAHTAGETGELVRGVELVRNKFLSTLGEYGVTKRPAQGQAFDPAWHEALGISPVANPEQDGKVLHVIEDAYAIGDVPLRPARVMVGKLEQ